MALFNGLSDDADRKLLLYYVGGSSQVHRPEEAAREDYRVGERTHHSQPPRRCAPGGSATGGKVMTDTKDDVLLEDVLNDLAMRSTKPRCEVLGSPAVPEVRRRRLPTSLPNSQREAISDAVDEDLEPSTTGTSPAVSKALGRLQVASEVRREEAARRASGQDLFGVLDREQFRSAATRLV